MPQFIEEYDPDTHRTTVYVHFYDEQDRLAYEEQKKEQKQLDQIERMASAFGRGFFRHMPTAFNVTNLLRQMNGVFTENFKP